MKTERKEDAAELLKNLESMGIRLWLEGSQIHYRAPEGLMTADRLAELRSRRDQLAELLASMSRAAAVQPDPAARLRPFPVTDVQAAYLTGRGSGYQYGGVGCHGYGELRFDGVDPVRLNAAWDALVRRHDMLRAVVSADGVQRVLRDSPGYHIEVGDVGDATPEEFAAAVAATRAELDHRVYQPGEWPLFSQKLTLARERAILHFSIDFLIADFVSIRLLLDELEQEYRQPGSVGTDLAVTFRDLQLARSVARSGPQALRDREYWLDRIDGLPEPPELPVLAPGESRPRFRRFCVQLPEPAWSGLKRRAQAVGLTPSCAVLAAYAEVIRRWSRNPDFTLNVTVLSRPSIHPQVHQIVGDFTSIELLAARAGEPGPFRGRASALQQQLWEDLDHGLYSGIDLMRELRKRRPGGLTLFPVVFTSSLGLGAGGQEHSGGMNRLEYGISQTPQVWLDCQVMEIEGRLECNLDVREAVFSAGVDEAMAGALQDLLGHLADTDDGWESKSPVPVPARQRARRPRPASGPPLSAGALLQDLLVEQAGANPGLPAVVTSSSSLSYGELVRRAAGVAEALASHGCRPGSLVAVEMDKGPEQIVAILGVLASGCAYVPVDVTQPAARRDLILADAGTRLVLTQSWQDRVRPPAVRAIAVDALGEGGPLPPVRGRGSDLAYVIYTSGSTGAPKGVMVSHRAALNTVTDINARFGITAGDRILGLANLGFDLSVYDIFGLLSVGGAVVLPDADRRADPAHWAGLIEDRRVTIWNSVPAQLEMLMTYLRSDPQPELAAMRLALLSGDWIPVSLPATVWQRMPALKLVGLGGATEASIWSIFHQIDEVDPSLPSIPYGRPLSGQSVRVLDHAMAEVPDLVTGEICISGEGLADGYLADRAKTADRFVTSPLTGERCYRTGDLGRYLADGSIEFLGREDLQVKIRGHRVELAEVEAALAAHPAIAAAAVVTVGERPAPLGLAAFAEAAGQLADGDPGGVPAAELRSAAMAGAAPLRAQVTAEEMLAFARQLDATALLQMLAALRSCGLFADERVSHTLQDILTVAQVAPRHRRLVRRWLAALRDNGLVRQNPDGRYAATASVDAAAVEQSWRRVSRQIPEVEQRTELLTYFQTTAGKLPELLRGEVDPLTLLFPEGRTEIHEVAYNAMFLSRYLNRLLTSAAGRLARQWHGAEPFRVLEVGAGVGGTSAELIPALAPFGVEYLFTDVSEFFLNNARRHYAKYDKVSYARYDMNQDFRRQGLAPNSCDLVVCANVLHYARSADAVLNELKQLLQPGGWLLLLEATKDNYQIMTSMEFLFDETAGEFEDVRRLREQTFLTRHQWLDVLTAAGADSVLCLPEQDPITDQMGMHFFAARFKTGCARVVRAELERHLVDTIPGHMLPSQLQIVDKLPVTGNGKIDRAVLRSWLRSAAPGTVGDGEMPAGEVEQRIARVWQRLLRVEKPGRNQRFFELGGDSLVAAQLATEIRECVPGAEAIFYDSLLRMILGNASIASLAARLGEEPAPPPAVPEAGGSALLRFGDRPGPPAVLVHDGTGTLESCRPLLEVLRGSTAVAGLAVPSPDRYLAVDAATLVDEVAAGYTRELRAAGEKLIRLAGRGFGGILAAETARQFMETGGRVERLVVVTAIPPAWPPADELLAELHFWQELGIGAGRLLPTGQDAGSGSPGQLQLERLREEPREERFGRLGHLLPGTSLEEAYEVFLHSMEGAAAHELLPYAGDIVLVRSQSSSAGRSGTVEEAGYWRDACLGELTVVDLACAQENCVRDAAGRLSGLLAGEQAGVPG